MTTALTALYIGIGFLIGRSTYRGLMRDGMNENDALDVALAGFLALAVGTIWPVAVLGLGLLLWASAEADKDGQR